MRLSSARHAASTSGSAISCSLCQETRFGLQPITDDPRALLAVLGPGPRKAIVGDFVALDTKRVLNDLGGAIAVVGADCTFEKVGHCAYSSRMTGHKPSTRLDG